MANELSLNVSGMTCTSCEVLIERKLRHVQGVESVRVNHASGRARLTYQARPPTLEQVQSALAGTHYKVSYAGSPPSVAVHIDPPPQDQAGCCGKQDDCCKNQGGVAQESGPRPERGVELEKPVQRVAQHVVAKQDRERSPDQESVLDKRCCTTKDYLDISALFILFIGVYMLLSKLDVLPKVGFSSTVSYGLVFGVGLVAAFSTCMAVSGGLLLAVTAKVQENNEGLSKWDRLKPTAYFSLGRLVSYTVLGSVLGVVGSAFTFSPRITGFLTILVSGVMIVLGVQLLHVFPGISRLIPKMPKVLAHRIYDASATDGGKKSPFLFGALTFFLPCGFTQALQLYVLTTGSFMSGALTLGVFALGTLPGLFSLGAASGLVSGEWKKFFFKAAGVLVVLVGVFGVASGFTLTGSTLGLSAFTGSLVQDGAAAQADFVPLVDGKQVVEMRINGFDYSPARFTLRQGVPVEWRVDGRGAQGCAQVLTLPKLGVTEFLPRDQVRTIAFTPTEVGTLKFTCGMGMAGPGYFSVLPDTGGA